jgi:polysaccharide export outer membrane protein
MAVVRTVGRPSVLAVMACVASAALAQAQAPANASATQPNANAKPPGVVVPADYVIGADDVLTILFWREKEMSGDVQVRPDGRISLPLLNDVVAAGLTPEQLRVKLTEASTMLIDPAVTVVVKQINSRKVYITGNVNKPGPYPLGGPTTVMQLITTAGGLLEYADQEDIGILRTDAAGKQTRLRFNYKDVARGRRLEQNILLKPGDTIIVP